MIDKVNIKQSGLESPNFDDVASGYDMVHRLAEFADRATSDSKIEAQIYIPFCNPEDKAKVEAKFPDCHISVNSNYIQFEDKEVHRLLVANTTVNTTKDEGITLAEASVAVGSSNFFLNNKFIKNFNAFKYFPNWKIDGTNYGGTFSGCTNLEKVTLPSNRTAIGYYEFNGCTNLTTILGAENVNTVRTNGLQGCSNLSDDFLQALIARCTTLGIYALGNTQISVVNAPNLTGSMGYAFPNCANLKRVENLGTITKMESNGDSSTTNTFAYCSNLISVVLPPTLTEISQLSNYRSPFYNAAKLQWLEFQSTTPPTIYSNTLISSNCFHSIFVPDASVDTYKGATYWSANAQYIRPLSEKSYWLTPITFADAEVERVLRTNTITSGKFTDDGLPRGGAALVTSLGTMFNNNAVIQNFEELADAFPNVTFASNMGANTASFRLCTNLKKITLPKNTTSLSATFYGCSSLEYINGLERLETLGATTFWNCKNLKIEASFPNLTGTIGTQAFASSGFTKINDLGTVTSITSTGTGTAVFYNMPNLTFIKLPSTLTTIGVYAFGNCANLEYVALLATTPPSLGSNAFYGCNALKSIFVPDSAVDTYKSASGWSTYASKIRPISESEWGGQIEFYDKLTGDGNAYIDTGIVVDGTTDVISMDAMCGVKNVAFFGARSSYTSILQLSQQNVPQKDIRVFIGSATSTTLKTDGVHSKIVNMEMNLPSLTFTSDTQSGTLPRNTGIPNLSVWLFKCHSTYDTPTYGASTFSNFKVTRAGSVIIDLYPCKKNGVIGMFDRKNQVFYPNSGEGTFTVSND